MKATVRQIIILGMFFLILSCKRSDALTGPSIYFESPQPINDSELSSFPKRFLGLYVNSDSSYLRVKQNIILTEKRIRFRFHKNVIDSLKNEFDYSNGRYFLKGDKRIYYPKIKGDSIELFTVYIDTFFIFSKTQKVKLLHRQLVLSAKDSIFWTTKILRIENKKLIIKQLFSAQDVKRMDSITKIKAVILDSSSYVLKPTRLEFIQFLHLKHFGYDYEYFKVIQ